MGAAVQLEGRLVGGDAVGASDSWRGGRSGTHWKDRGEGTGEGRGRRRGGVTSAPGPWGVEQQERGGRRGGGGRVPAGGARRDLRGREPRWRRALPSGMKGEQRCPWTGFPSVLCRSRSRRMGWGEGGSFPETFPWPGCANEHGLLQFGLLQHAWQVAGRGFRPKSAPNDGKSQLEKRARHCGRAGGAPYPAVSLRVAAHPKQPAAQARWAQHCPGRSQVGLGRPLQPAEPAPRRPCRGDSLTSSHRQPWAVLLREPGRWMLVCP